MANPLASVVTAHPEKQLVKHADRIRLLQSGERVASDAANLLR
jgi:hypothetical protein